MFDYSKVTSRSFEKLAQKYLEQKYPEFVWNITPPSGDGNKDILCTYKVLNQEYEYWAEAKFTKGQAPHSLLKGQLDPTLVSALLSPKQISICFISNNEITENYYYRLNDFKLKTNIGIDLVLKNEFEEWLLNNPQYLDEYNIKLCVIDEKQEHINFAITSATITDVQNSNQYKPENVLLSEVIYYLYIIIDSAYEFDHAKILINSEFALIFRSKRLDNPEDFKIKKGKHVYKFELIPTESGSTKLDIQVFSRDNFVAQYCMGDLMINPNINIALSYIQQEKSLLEILRYIRESDEHNFLIPIIGNGATGKTKLMHDLYCELDLTENILSISFSGNDLLDQKSFLKILIYFNMGNIFDYEKEDILSQLDIVQDVEKKIFYQKLIHGFFDAPEICIQELLRKLADNKVCLLYPIHSNIKQVLLLDDMHKIGNDILSILWEFFKQFLQQKNNEAIIFTAREFYGDFSLDINILKRDWIKTYLLDGLSKEDKLMTISRYITINNDIQFDRATDDLIVFSNILHSKISEEKDFDSISKNVDIVRAFEKPNIINLFQYKEQLNQLWQYNDIIELIYLIYWGIPYSDITQIFPAKDIEFLLKRRAIKRIGRKIYPYHDYYVKSYFEEHTISNNTIEIIKKICNIDYSNKYLYLSSLMQGGYYIYNQIEEEVRQLENYYFKATDYYKAYTLSKAIECYINKNEKLSFEELHDLLILAISSGYFEEPMQVQERYKELMRFCKPLENNIEVQGIILRAKSEIINIDYWELNNGNLLKEIQNIIKSVPIIQKNSGENAICGFLNLLNRKMVVALLDEDYEGAEQIFNENMQEIKRLNRNEYVGYLYMDFAKGIYNHDTVKALQYMEKAQKIFRSLNTEHRRLIDCNCEVQYLKCLLSDNSDFTELERAANILREEQYFELFSKAKLKIAALKITKGKNKYTKADIEQDIFLSEYALNYVATGRLLLLHIMVKNAFRIFSNEPHKKIKLTATENKLLNNMGLGFKEIWKSNEIGIKRSVQFAIQNISYDTYVIDPRIW